MWPDWSNMLGGWQWGALLAVPPALVALYFLKLKRQPLIVPSTLLWRQTLEDLHVNSLWQKLRNSLLLWLQLLLVLLVILALLKPSWQGSQRAVGRSIVLIDNSASMQATDVTPTRLDEAKRRAIELIDQMTGDDVAMVISFADAAQVAQSFTHNRHELRRAVESIAITDRPTNIAEALRAAAGLTQSSHSTVVNDDAPLERSEHATVYVFSDGKFPDVQDLSLRNLSIKMIAIGSTTARNVAITALGVAEREGPSDTRPLFARVENFSAERVNVEVTLLRDGTLLDADKLSLDANSGRGMTFDLTERDDTLELRIQSDPNDHLSLDDRAIVVLGAPRRSRILLITPGNEPLKLALNTQRAAELVELQVESPAYLDDPRYQAIAALGACELIIYDRCVPTELPQTNTLSIGRVPPLANWSVLETVAAPQIIDVDTTHPLMHLVEMGDVLLAEGTPLKLPSAATVLIDSDRGPLFAVAPRDTFEDAVLGIELIGADKVGTNWPLRLSFPVFVLNVLEHFAHGSGAATALNVRSGQTIRLPLDASQERLSVETPTHERFELTGPPGRSVHFSQTSRVGLYEVHTSGVPVTLFAVNLLDAAESDVRLRADGGVQIGAETVTSETGWQSARREGWRYLAFVALGVLVVEWYLYNRRLGR